VSLAKCRACARRDGNKPLTVFYAWRNVGGDRLAYKTTLCVSCFAAKVSPLDLHFDGVERLRCPNCGIDTDDDYDAVFVNCFIPHYGRRDIEAPFCNACAAHYRIWVQECGDALEDRGRADDSPSPMLSASATLRALGLRDPNDAA
jgi:hypothetical protein